MKHFEEVMDVLALRSSARIHHWMMWVYATSESYEEAMTSQLLYLACSSEADEAMDKLSGEAIDTMVSLFDVARDGR